MMLVGDMPKRNSAIYPKKIGLIDSDKRFTYKEVNLRINRLGNALQEMGLKKGEKVAVMAPNCHQFVELYFAVAKTGLVVVPINTRFLAEEASRVINHSESSIFFYHNSLEAVAAKVRENIPGVKHFISIWGGGNGETYSYEDLVQKGSVVEAQEKIDQDDIMMIMYTSGTTGTPKGVLTSHRNVMANTNTMVIELQIATVSVNLLVMPMYHNGGFWPVMAHFYRGATTIILPHFDLEQVLQLVEKEKVTFLNLVPTTLIRLISHPKIWDYNLESLQLVMYASAPIALEKIKKAMKILGPQHFYTGLGSTEACGSMISFPAAEHALALDGPLAEKLGTVGRDSIGVEIKIVDECGNEIPTGEVGEIIARGDNISPGYWKIPEENIQTFRKGWLYTGDMGYRDEDGYIFLTGRKKDIIISGGENISSREVEEAIYQHPYIEEVAVIGVPDEEWGEAVKAVVSINSEYRNKVTKEEIIEFCKSRLSGYKRPKSVDFVDELPKNSLGKVDKKHLSRFYNKKTSK